MSACIRHALVLAFAASACDVATSDLDARVAFIVEGDQLQVNASFFDDDGARNVDDSHIAAVFRGEEYKLSLLATGTYLVDITLTSPIVADEPITVVVDREDQTDASSTMLVPPSPELAELPLFISRAKPLELTWTPATDDEMTWNLTRCLRGDGDIPPGLTMFAIDPKAIEYDQLDEGTCSATLQVSRRRLAPVDPAFAEGEMIVVHRIEVEFASTP